MRRLLPELRALLRLAGPIVLGQVSLMTLGVTDMVMVGRLGAVPLAALAVAGTFFFSFFIMGLGTLMVLDPLVSQAWGAGEHRRCGRWLARGALAAVALAVPLALVLGLLAEPALRFLRQPPEVVPLAAAYLRALVPGVFFRLLFVAGRQVLLGQGRVRLPLVAVLLANVLNVLLDGMLVLGWFGVPAIGVVGAGWATSACDLFMAVVLYGAVLADGDWRRHQAPRSLRQVLSPTAWRRFLRLGLPLGLQHALEGWGFVLATFMAGWMGATVVAGHQVALNLASVSYMVPLGIAAAGSVRVGQGVGRGDRTAVTRAAQAALLAGLVMVGVFGGLFVGIPEHLARGYTADAAAVAVAVSVLPVAAAFQLFDATQVIGFGLLRGLGDTRFPALANAVGFWILGIPAGYAMAFPGGLGPRGIWWGLALGLAVVSVMLMFRLRWLLARPIRRVEEVPLPVAPDPHPGAV